MNLFKSNIPITNPLVVTFKEEPAVDAGGPRREYFTLLMKHISTNFQLFEGPTGHLLPTHNVPALIDKQYYYIGKMMAASILQGGPAPGFFAESAAEYWLQGLDGVTAHVEDIPGEAQLVVKKVKIMLIYSLIDFYAHVGDRCIR